jgi:hypothetical protein
LTDENSDNIKFTICYRVCNIWVLKFGYGKREKCVVQLSVIAYAMCLIMDTLVHLPNNGGLSIPNNKCANGLFKVEEEE